MLERFINKTTFESQEDFIKNFKIKVSENFNFGYDVVDAWAEEEPDKIALCWTNDQGEHIDFTFADLKNIPTRLPLISSRWESATVIWSC